LKRFVAGISPGARHRYNLHPFFAYLLVYPLDPEST
jgi:hypothetical protein